MPYVYIKPKSRTLKGKGDYKQKRKAPAYLSKRKLNLGKISDMRKLQGYGDYRPSDYEGRATGDMAEAVAHRGASYLIKKGRDALSKLMATIFGSGDYVKPGFTIKSNTLWNLAEQIPQMHSAGHSTVFRHREYLCDITSSATAGAFKIQSFLINPGYSATFPWLSNIASTSYQKYRIRGMIFEFRSMSGDALNSVNTALGTVIMSTNYSAIDAPFQNKAQMENTDFGMSARPSMCMVHPIECDPRMTPLSEQYVANGTENRLKYDPRMDDLGVFYIATQCMQGASVNVGELWVSYDIELITPIQTPALSNGGVCHVQLNSASLATVAAGNVFGVSTSGNFNVRINDLGLRQNFSGNKIEFDPNSFKPGSLYFLMAHWKGTVAAALGATIVGASANLSFPNYFNNDTSAYDATPSVGGVNATVQDFYVYFQVQDSTALSSITFLATVVPSSMAYFDLFITEVDANMTS